ncbi:MAG TPA: helix-turn-helix domain-containing protein [Solirubrobacteraceae bacterium]|jgi:excisionase family DNA binding protein|nr:helix-turn-helix domain-containing protein [Solirubrobacteraceae bacterium]
MSEQLYSAEEAAQVLGLQVRTVRNYLREGRLPGVRIGKQYRISRADLEAFMGGGLARGDAGPDSPKLPPAGAALEVSSVVQVDRIDQDSADRIIRTLTAATAGRSESEPPLRVEPMYDETRRRLKIIIVGAAADTIELIRVVEALIPSRT